MTTPEEAANYLRRTNFKALIEWVTAECILHRPEDPLHFCARQMEMKLKERGTAQYNSEAPMEFLKATYEKASTNADEHGRIYADAGDNREIAEDGAENNRALNDRLETLESIIRSCRAIATQLDPNEAQAKIVEETCHVLKADRATIFRVDKVAEDLVVQEADEGARHIRVPLGKGIAGTVGQDGMVINIPDAYADARFDQSHDEGSGYKTQTILCGPIKSATGEILGVLQVINKEDGAFTEEDEGILELLAAQAGIALQNADLFAQTARSRARFRSLVDIITALQSDMGLSSLVFTMSNQAPRVVDGDRGTVFLVDEKDDSLWSMEGSVNMRFPKGSGIAGTVAVSGETINIADAYADPRFNQDVDKKTGYHTRTILCMPILAAGKTVGVCQVINKKEGSFDAEDEEVMGAFLSMAGPIIQSSQLFQKSNSAADSTGSELTGDSPRRMNRGTTGGTLPEMAEEEEEVDTSA